MSVIVSVFYPLWYYSYRKRIKEILETDTNTAKTILDQIVTEHDTVNDVEENLKLHHAKVHLNSFIETGQSHQKPAATTALEE